MDFKKMETEPMMTILTGTDPALLGEEEAGLETAGDPGGQAKEGDDFDYGFFVRTLDETEERKKKPQPRLCDEEEIARLNALEAEGKGIWATVKETAKAYRISKQTVKRGIRKGMWKIKKEKFRGKRGYRYMVWLDKPVEKGAVISRRRGNTKEIGITVTRPMLIKLYDMSKISQDRYDELINQRDLRFQLKLIVPEKTLYHLIETSMVKPE